jgi:hypothetical protein
MLPVMHAAQDKGREISTAVLVSLNQGKKDNHSVLVQPESTEKGIQMQ